jgi:hypothetical protein
MMNGIAGCTLWWSEPIFPVVRLVVGGGPEVLLPVLVLAFDLATSLSLQRGPQPVINTDMTGTKIPESAGEHYSAIGNNLVWYALNAYTLMPQNWWQLW